MWPYWCISSVQLEVLKCIHFCNYYYHTLPCEIHPNVNNNLQITSLGSDEVALHVGTIYYDIVAFFLFSGGVTVPAADQNRKKSAEAGKNAKSQL